MAIKRPLVLYGGRIEELRVEDSMPQLAQIAYPKRSATPKIVGDAAGANLVTVVLSPSRQYFIPLAVPREVVLTGLRISVTTGLSGTASIGIYNNTEVNDSDAPGELLDSVTNLDIGTTGEKTGSLSYTLQAGTLYWASMIASSGATVRALPIGSQQTALGRVINAIGVISYLHADGSGSTLPATAPGTLSFAAAASVPAIYLLE